MTIIQEPELLSVGPEIVGEHSDRLLSGTIDLILEQAEAVCRIHAEHLIEDDETHAAQELLAAMFALRELPVGHARRLAFHPTFQYWVKGMRRTSGQISSPKSANFRLALPTLLWAELALAGQIDRPWTVLTDRKGGLRCPGRQRYVEMGSGYSNSRIDLSCDDDEVRLQAEDGLTVRLPLEDLNGELQPPPPTVEQNGYHINVAPALCDGRIEFWSREDWLRVRFTGTNQRDTGVEFYAVDDVLYPSSVNAKPYEDAFSLIQDHWPAAIDDVCRFTRVVVPIDSGPHIRRAFTVSSRQGAIFIDEADAEDIVENVLHENAHVKLRCIQMFDSLLVHPEDNSVRIKVAWRKDPRPIPGILEGVYVFSHVAEYEYRRAMQEDGAPSSRFQEMVAHVQEGLSALREHAKLTEIGNSFLDRVGSWHADQKARC